MKKVLFATTALIATAGMAAADVRISGYGRFGLDYNEANKGVPAAGRLDSTDFPEFSITSRLRLQFDMSTETDSGVTLGARFRAQAESRDGRPASGPINLVDLNGDGTFDAVQAGGGAQFNGARFFATWQGLTVAVGNILGAIENTPGLYLETRSAGTGIDGMGFVSLVTNVNGNYFNWDAYSSAGYGVNNGVEVLYSAGGFNGQISYSKDNDTVCGTAITACPAAVTMVDGLQRTAINLSYTWNDWTGSIAYQDSNAFNNWQDKFLFTVYGDLGNFGIRFAYADNKGIDKFGLYGSYDIGAASTIVAWVTNESAVSASDVALGRNDNRDGVAGSNNQEGTAFGLNYSYDLGGGASIETGYVYNSAKFSSFQAGVYFSF